MKKKVKKESTLELVNRLHFQIRGYKAEVSVLKAEVSLLVEANAKLKEDERQRLENEEAALLRQEQLNDELEEWVKETREILVEPLPEVKKPWYKRIFG